MATIDIREQVENTVDTIVFAEEFANSDKLQAYSLCLSTGNYFTIEDSSDCVVISTKEHALDLIKAIEKAIELKWVK